MDFYCMSTRQKFQEPNPGKVRMSNGRFAYVANSPFREGKLAYRFAESSEKKSRDGSDSTKETQDAEQGEGS